MLEGIMGGGASEACQHVSKPACPRGSRGSFRVVGAGALGSMLAHGKSACICILWAGGGFFKFKTGLHKAVGGRSEGGVAVAAAGG
jgi:hypothetical protein